MALRILLGRTALLSKGPTAPATARHFFRSALTSEAAQMPETPKEMAAFVKAKGLEGLSTEQLVAKISAEFPAGTAADASSGPDIVKEVFYNTQRKFRQFAAATEDLTLPEAGDDDGIRAYAHARMDIMDGLNIPTPEESIAGTLESEAKEMKEDGGTVKAYLAFVAEQRVAMGINDGGLGKALEAAVAAQEKASGKTLMVGDPEMQAVIKSITPLLEELEIEDYADEDELQDNMFESAVEEAEFEIGQLAEKRAARVAAEKAKYGASA